jgi:hypothetical protein
MLIFDVFHAVLLFVALTLGAVLSILLAAALVHTFVLHALSFIVTLHVPLYVEIVQLHHATFIDDHVSVLHANVHVTIPFVGVLNVGLYVHVPHTGSTLSNLYVPLTTLLFPATSYAHTYKYLVHSTLSVILALFAYVVPFDQQCANVALAFHVQ